MFKKKPFFIVLEGVEGCGKSYQSKKLYKALKRRNIPVILTREPGGTEGAEKIRNIILKDYFNPNSGKEFNKYTDTLLYLASRNEHIVNKLMLEIRKKKIVICDRFIDSTLAYQVYGKKVSKNLVDSVHKHILKGVKPDITFVLKVSISKALKRINKRKNKNRYDKFSKQFYNKVQNAFIKIARSNKRKYIILDNTEDSRINENFIFNKILRLFNK